MKKVVIILAALSSTALFGREKFNTGERPAGSSGAGHKVMANCAAPNASQELKLNNVRTILFSGGDMWWDRNGTGNAFYYIPNVTNRNTGVSSSFAGSIWLGGLDAGGQLKVAAMTYRQNGIDFWSGPLDTTNASADPAVCAKYDQIYSITRTEVEDFVAGGLPSAALTNWPGNGDVSKKQGKRLAPFVDVDNDGVYDPAGSRDYPAYDIENKAEKDNLGFCKTKLFGDQTLFWVFNDNGGIHTETQGVPIGVEVRAQAFAFKTNDEINNMTFYSYEVYNRSSFQLNQTYFTVWTDADLGYFLDDYVGCDVKRGLGYIYNADPFDETAMGTNGYQDYPPALGCDFFKGPLADYNPETGIGDGIDNDQDGLMDEVGETIQMSRFTYYNNNYGAFPPQTVNPDNGIAIHYYNYMTGKWKDGSPFTVGGNAYGGTTPATFVYDGNPVTGTGWTEKGSGNPPGDRRFLQSAGPFTLKPGAVNEITFGVPWAQSSSKGGNIQSIDLLFNADDKAQALFNNCFKLLDGPEAPVMTIQEMNNELIFYLTNEKGKNNYKQFNNDYAEEDISIISDPTYTYLANPDKIYKFEGYIVYQVKNEGVTSTDLSDRTKAIPVFQADVANGHGRLINYEQDNSVGGFVPKVKVEGADKGISTTFKITDDAFSTLENRKLVNNKQYYFLAVAYAFNEYLPYKPDVSPAQSSSENSLGQKRPYLEGRKYKRASGTPHNTDLEKGGTMSQAFYGFGPKITRVEGQGNGGNMLTLTQASENDIVANFFKADLTYENAQGPLNIKVVDPLNVKDSKFSFKFINYQYDKPAPTPTDNAMVSVTAGTPAITTYTGTVGALNINKTSWELKDLVSGKTYYATEIKENHAATDNIYQPIKVGNEFYFPDLGFSVNVKQVGDPGDKINRFTDFMKLIEDSAYAGPQPGSFIGASISYVNGQPNWLNSLKDADGQTPTNWILSGTNKTKGTEDAHYNVIEGTKIQAFYDPDKQFGNILGGTWAPYPLCASYYSITPGTNGFPSRSYGGPGFSGQIWKEDQESFKRLFGQAQTATSSQPDEGNTDLRKLSSSLIVFTKDKSKWTRCVVLEMQEKSRLSEGNAIFFSPRNHQSVDKDGKSAPVGSGAGSSANDANFISETSMGWFPGYAINLETGERLNMAFGEDSYQKENNGNDMIWNPTSNVDFPFQYAMGGKHFVYVFGGNSVTSKFTTGPTAFSWLPFLNDKDYGVGRYDYGQKMMTIMKGYFNKTVFGSSQPQNGAGLDPINAIERDIMWVSIPMPLNTYNFITPDQMPSDVRFQINVAKPYRYGWSGVANLPPSPYQGAINKLVSVNNPSLLTADVKPSPENANFPMYTFNTSDIATLYDQMDVSKNAMDRIMIVPNPYYGSSTYESNRTDNKIRITNLPSKCTVKIFTMNGTLVRTIKRDVTGQEDLYTGASAGGNEVKTSKRSSYVEWDLKNQNNISVASGLYIFHIDAPGVGEKILKWFGVMRPLDVQSY